MKLLEGFHNHHIVPRYKGGDDSPENLVLLHPIDHAIAHLVRFKMYGDVRDKWASNWLLKIEDPAVYSAVSKQREALIKEKRKLDPVFDQHMKRVKSQATKNRKEGYQKEAWLIVKKKMAEDNSYNEKIRESRRKAKLVSQAACNKKNEERVRCVRQMRAQGYKYSEISKETGFFISVISGIVNGKSFVGVGEL
jgi:hypothetical protein